MKWVIMLTFVFFLPVAGANEDCFDRHAQTHGLSADLLRAIALVESSGNPKAIGKNAASEDLGLMQINSRWIKPMDTSKARLLNDACFNVEAGAKILADNFSRFAHPWEAVGAYNAGCSRLKGEDCLEARRKYAWKVYRRLLRLTDEERLKLKNIFS